MPEIKKRQSAGYAHTDPQKERRTERTPKRHGGARSRPRWPSGGANAHCRARGWAEGAVLPKTRFPGAFARFLVT